MKRQAHQPGSNSQNIENDLNEESDVVSSVSQQKMNEKKDLRTLNERLSVYVQNQAKQRQTIESYKRTLAKQEIEFRNKLKDKENQFNQINEKLRSENESFQYQTKQLSEELHSLENTNLDLQKRIEMFQKCASEKDSEIEGLKHQITIFSTELKTLRTENADIKYKYENHDSERKQLMQQYKQLKDKSNHLMKDLTKRQSENRSQCDAFNRLLKEKCDENDRLNEENKLLNKEKNDIQEKLRIEFDTKLKDFIDKRELQYKQEKEEWMRIFKQEFNRKLRNYKDANIDLSNNNNKLEEEIIDLQSRISKFKQIKDQYELQIRNLETETEKIRNDFDTLRKMKDLEIKNKTQLILELREQKKQRDIEFDEVVGIKIHLSQEIELYRRILGEAEQNAGYTSPLNNTNNRKKRRFINGNTITNNGDTLGCVTETPGLLRGAQIARRDLNKLQSGTDTENENDNETVLPCNDDDIDTEVEDTDIENDNENSNTNSNSNGNNNNNKRMAFGHKRLQNNMHKRNMDCDNNNNEYKDSEDSENAGGDIINNNDNTYVTPGGEPWPLQFSTMDLTRSMIEIQNISDAPVSLRGYTLSNSDGHAQFPLPSDKILNPNEKLRIKIGLRAKKDNDNCTILWKADVWTGDEDDVARLYDPNQNEIARIDITPDMLPKDKKNNANCNIM